MDWYYWLFRFFYFGSVIVSSIFWSLENGSGWWWSVLAALVGLYVSQMMYLMEERAYGFAFFGVLWRLGGLGDYVVEWRAFCVE